MTHEARQTRHEAGGTPAVGQESTRVHFGVDRLEADGIEVFAPESTNPPIRRPRKNTYIVLQNCS